MHVSSRPRSPTKYGLSSSSSSYPPPPPHTTPFPLLLWSYQTSSLSLHTYIRTHCARTQTLSTKPRAFLLEITFKTSLSNMTDPTPALTIEFLRSYSNCEYTSPTTSLTPRNHQHTPHHPSSTLRPLLPTYFHSQPSQCVALLPPPWVDVG